MSTDAARWPRLGLSLHPVLDWCETQYTAAQLVEIANAVRANPHPIEGRSAQGSPGLWNFAIEQVLRKLAETPAVLKELNRRGTTPPWHVKGLNRAVHYHVRMALAPEGLIKTAMCEVAKAWGCESYARVKDDVAAFRVDDADPHASQYVLDGVTRAYQDARGVPNAPFFVDQIVKAVCRRSGRTRAQVLADFDADMHDRGATEVKRKARRREKHT